ncbi:MULTISPECIES: hypothetical protein [unclassified Mycolicibacterium]|uniref:hypothetical protein n=1 Tax=unclassified Mycolicibacterium TaxID=2636767 RepID=UPI0012DDB479|nr:MULTISPECIES: hypothetical protein [unclassified Mycolicibacterium]MUL84288.1 hypothetical protein [Mycolicibacterium sp. CBMA 329]MUL89646.1 hypothetical protein [Mycolicibacterium sp. CBMA 331]MUM28773.1 hypothetical protein [Mycolicibacterium sp. CBMA 295]MUM39161.1 hypothetical protein [Mycolicibacterium sp. CBMA 247]MUM46247.1 hypothetical protein [Mycolicibacterium sp. CBMA 294]
MLSPTAARTALAVIRIINGATALVAPERLLTRLGVDTSRDRSGSYPFRMFGIRTVLIGLDLLTLRGQELRRAENLAVLIHAADTLSAAVTTARGDLPRRHGVTAIVISAINTALAIAARKGRHDVTLDATPEAIPAHQAVPQDH